MSVAQPRPYDATKVGNYFETTKEYQKKNVFHIVLVTVTAVTM